MSMRPYNTKQVRLSDARVYDIIVRPIVTEKSTLGAQFGQVTFEVAIDATKPEIKVAVEKLFERKVKAVNTVLTKGKVKRFRGRIGKRSNYKKAIVTFEDGQDIDVTQGV